MIKKQGNFKLKSGSFKKNKGGKKRNVLILSKKEMF